MPATREMLRRGGLLVAVLVVWLVVSLSNAPSWLATTSRAAVWIGAGFALFWLGREVLPTVRRRRGR